MAENQINGTTTAPSGTGLNGEARNGTVLHIVGANIGWGLAYIGGALIAVTGALITATIALVIFAVVDHILHFPGVDADKAYSIGWLMGQVALLVGLPAGALIFADDEEPQHLERILGYLLATVLIVADFKLNFDPVMSVGLYAVPALIVTFVGAGYPVARILEWRHRPHGWRRLSR